MLMRILLRNETCFRLHYTQLNNLHLNFDAPIAGAANELRWWRWESISTWLQ